MLAPAYEQQAVQAFPIHAETFMGTASDLSAAKKSVLHADQDCNVTFTFKTAGDKTFALLRGMDLGLTRDVQTITSDGIIWVS
jgi:hypothetical protein